MLAQIKDHLPEYAIEAWCLGTFMVSACVFGVAVYHPASPAASLNGLVRDLVMGLIMGSTAVGIIRSPWGRRSGAHFNPAVTVTFLRLGKITPVDAAGYIAAHFLGGVLGVLTSWFFLGDLLSESAVNFVATVPGRYGVGAAFAAEVIISFLMMSMILLTSNSRRLSHLTPFFSGMLVAVFITFESPISGMSMNPARSFGSAFVGGEWNAIWLYFVAPTAAMLLAAEVFVRTRGLKAVLCAKLDHHGAARCIFDCHLGAQDEPERDSEQRAGGLELAL